MPFTLKNKIQKKNPILGTWNTLGASLVTDAIAQSGLDFVIIDFEHGPFELHRISDYVSHCQAYGCAPIVRLPVPEPWMIQQALDQGAEGLMVPHMQNANDVKEFIRTTQFSPKGTRGFTPFTKAGSFNGTNAGDYVKHSNQNIVRSIIIESKEGFENLDEILEIEDLDIVYFGAYDLSAVFGHPGDIYHADVMKPLKQGIAKVSAVGKCAGGFVAHSQNDIKKLLNLGLKFITYGVDANLLYREYSTVHQAFKKFQ